MSGAQPPVVTPARAIVMSLAALSAATLPVFLTGALQGRIAADLDVGPGAIGTAVAGFFLAAAISSVPGGRLTDRIGATAGLRLGMLIATVAAVAVAVGADDRWHLTAALALGGVAVAFVDPGTARALTATVPYRNHGAAFGIKEASVPVASLLAGLVLPLLGAQFGWRPAFYLGAGIAVVTALLVPARLDEVIGGAGIGPARDATPGDAAVGLPGVAGTRSPRPDPAPDPGSDAARGASPAASEDGTSTSAIPGVEAGVEAGNAAGGEAGDQPRRTAALLAGLAVAAALAGGVAAAVAAFLVPTAQIVGLSAGAAGVLLSVGSLASVVARLGFGVMVDRRRATELVSITWLTAIGAVGVALLALLSASTPGLAAGSSGAAPSALAVVLLVVAGVAALGAGWGWTGLVFLAAVRLEPTRPARAAGAVLAGLGAGGSLGPALIGVIAERSGFAPTWAVGSSLMAVAALGVALLRRRMPVR